MFVYIIFILNLSTIRAFSPGSITLVKKQMLQAANTDLFNPLVPKAHNIVSVKIYYFFYKLIQQKSVKANWQIFIFYTLSTNGLRNERGPAGALSGFRSCSPSCFAEYLKHSLTAHTHTHTDTTDNTCARHDLKATTIHTHPHTPSKHKTHAHNIGEKELLQSCLSVCVCVCVCPGNLPAKIPQLSGPQVFPWWQKISMIAGGGGALQGGRFANILNFQKTLKLIYLAFYQGQRWAPVVLGAVQRYCGIYRIYFLMQKRIFETHF